MKKISIVTPCFNEQENAREIYDAVKHEMAKFPQYDWEHIFIDNASTDHTVSILRMMAAEDHRVKVIVNTRNFGPVRSPFYGLIQAKGDAVVLMAADFQEPPKLLPDFINKWEEGFKLVLAVKNKNEEGTLFFKIRKLYYSFLNRVSSVDLIKNTTAFGLYDQKIIETLRNLNEPYPYLRGLVSDLGYDIATVEYIQPPRKRGITKANFFILYDWLWLGLTSYSKVPLRLATITGFLLSMMSLFIAFVYLMAKLFLWHDFAMGVAPVIIGIFFFASVQLFFTGVLGEYIGAIYTKIENRPLVIEKERINFIEMKEVV